MACIKDCQLFIGELPRSPSSVDVRPHLRTALSDVEIDHIIVEPVRSTNKLAKAFVRLDPAVDVELTIKKLIQRQRTPGEFHYSLNSLYEGPRRPVAHEAPRWERSSDTVSSSNNHPDERTREPSPPPRAPPPAIAPPPPTHPITVARPTLPVQDCQLLVGGVPRSATSHEVRQHLRPLLNDAELFRIVIHPAGGAYEPMNAFVRLDPALEVQRTIERLDDMPKKDRDSKIYYAHNPLYEEPSSRPPPVAPEGPREGRERSASARSVSSNNNYPEDRTRRPSSPRRSPPPSAVPTPPPHATSRRPTSPFESTPTSLYPIIVTGLSPTSTSTDVHRDVRLRSIAADHDILSVVIRDRPRSALVRLAPDLDVSVVIMMLNKKTNHSLGDRVQYMWNKQWDGPRVPILRERSPRA